MSNAPFSGIVPPQQPIEPIGARELLSLYAVLGQVAQNQHVKPESVQARIEQEFGIDHIGKLHREDYRPAMEFLVDLRMDDLRSRK